MIHAGLAPKHVLATPYLGAAFLIYGFVSVFLAAFLLRRPAAWVWNASGFVCALGIATYVCSRTVGLPGHSHDVGHWSTLSGQVCLMAEGMVIVLAVTRRARITRRAAVCLFGLSAAAASTVVAHAAQPVAQGHVHQVISTDHQHDESLGAEGFQLVAGDDAAPQPPGPSQCPRNAPIRKYEVAAIGADIPLNRWGDHDPLGRAFVLQSDVAAVRSDEAKYAAARRGAEPVPVSLGLQSDLLQPLTLRVLPGECLRIEVRDDLPAEAVSLQLHGAALRVATTGRAATAAEPSAVAHPGQTTGYVWAVPATEPEGSHYFHSQADVAPLGRQQTAHGLYGAVIVEPPGSHWLDPTTQRPLTTGWAAVVTAPGRKAFREFALYYAEVGDETYQPLDRKGAPLPQAESLSGAYRPGGRAINYRSEPFYDRLLLETSHGTQIDDSISYSSYAFGDPATPMMRSYLGDPTTQRIIHAGTETAHVHHVHGGSVRWPRQPGADVQGKADAATGLDKHPSLLPGPSERTDSQTIGPSETYDIHDECGAGGCQQSAGDFLFHCHIAHHYFAGMWGIWRVYNTLQDGVHSTDELAVLPSLPDRVNAVEAGVDSSRLIGGPVAKVSDLHSWLQRHLPPPGAPRGYDASVWDWTMKGQVALGEADDTATWANYSSHSPGKRSSILFDPKTGKPAFPMLRPHLGRRPPFAPGHGPAPFLDAGDVLDPTSPGAQGPSSVCPSGTRLQQLRIKAIETSIPLNKRQGLLDPAGKLFVLQEQEAAIRADPDLRRPLTVRANAGEDCLDVTLTNGMTDATDPHGFSKVSMHVHFVQFDVQGSDGVDGGFNYEQTVRPYATEGLTLLTPAPAGARSIQLQRAPAVGALIGIGMERASGFETAQIARTEGSTVFLTRPLGQSHVAGEVASTEFVRYRWYPDVQVGTAFFHDHVNAILGQPHGLYGGLVVEPPGSSYTDPVSGKAIGSGPVADIHTSKPASVDVKGSFRELVTFLGDDVPVTSVGRDTGGTLNLRVEPLAHRLDPAAPFKGEVQTPTLSAYVGDPVVFRTLVGASNEVHTFHLDGHGFRTEPWSLTSPLTSTVPIGISERFDLSTVAGGPRAQPGDYLFGNGRLGKLEGGSWGLLRVLPGSGSGLQRLPGQTATAPQPICPARAFTEEVGVSAVELPMPMLDGARGIALVRTGSTPGPPRPLVLHVRSGGCLKVDLTNATQRVVSLHADLLGEDPADAAVGRNADKTTGPSKTHTYSFYADPSLGATVAQLRDGVDPVTTMRRGMYGAIVVDPAGSTTTKGADGASAVVRTKGGKSYRDFTVFMQDGDQSIGTHRMPYTKTVDGVAAISYGSSSLASRLQAPELLAYVGDPVLMHVVVPASEQTQVFTVDGHTWPIEPGLAGTNHVSAATVGGMQTLTISLDGGAGGPSKVPDDYRYGDARAPYALAGMWGSFRVLPRSAEVAGLPHLAGKASHPRWWLALGVAALTALVLAIAIYRRRRPT